MQRHFLFLALAACGAAHAADEAPWRRMAEQDLGAVHDTIAARHPGPVDARNPQFAEWHERGYRDALALAARADDFDGYEAAMRHYVNGFHDGHLGLSLDMQAGRVSWPGFVVAWRDGAMRVHHVAQDLSAPHAGDAIVACDGIAAEALYTQRVLPYHGNPEIAGSRARVMPRTFLDSTGARTKLKSCTFRGPDGEHRVDLAWRNTQMDRVAPFLRAAATGEAPTVGVRRVAGNGAWLSMPDFGVSGAGIDAMQAALAEVPKHRDARYFVIDVRGNGGGSSHWGGQAIAALYGEAFGQWMEDDANWRTKDSYVEFRVSQETADHFRHELPRLAQGAGKDSIDYRYFARIVEALDAAVARKDTLLDDRAIQRELFGTPKAPGPKPAPRYDGRVYFLTDANCASACLDFADQILLAPNVVHVGQPTSGDTVYMDVASLRLPSHAGTFGFATKVYRGRPRGRNEAYVPKHAWTGDPWKTDDLERWIATLATGAR
jgi:hypothetical protein